MTTESRLDLDAIEGRANAATPGPWHTTRNADTHWLREARDADGHGVAWCGNSDVVQAHADAAFIAAARAGIPALIAECRSLMARAEKSEAELAAVTPSYVYLDGRLSDVLRERGYALGRAESAEAELGSSDFTVATLHAQIDNRDEKIVECISRAEAAEAKLAPPWLADAAEALGEVRPEDDAPKAMNWTQVAAAIRDMRYERAEWKARAESAEAKVIRYEAALRGIAARQTDPPCEDNLGGHADDRALYMSEWADWTTANMARAALALDSTRGTK